MNLLSMIRNYIKLPDFLNIEDKIVARILYGFLAIIPPTFLVIIYLRIQVQDMTSIVILLVYFCILISTVWLIKLKKVKLSVILIIMSTLISITALCTFGQGIRDISMVAFSGVIILACLLLDRKEFFFFLFLIIGCVAWLVFGEIYGFYTIRSINKADTGDFVIIAVIILIVGTIANLLAMNLRQSIHDVQEENRERRKVELQLKQNLKEKEALLREVHHRVKNNLNVINSLMNLQERQIHTKAQAIEAFKNTHNRIYAMALVHEQLYQSEKLSYVPMHVYIRSLVRRFRSLFGDEQRVEIQTDISMEIVLEISVAIPCGMIITEAITNAVKHGFPKERSGKVNVLLKKEEDEMVSLTVSDNGQGLPDNFDPKHLDSMGIHLMQLLTQQMNGRFSVISENGTCIQVIFPWNLPAI